MGEGALTPRRSDGGDVRLGVYLARALVCMFLVSPSARAALESVASVEVRSDAPLAQPAADAVRRSVEIEVGRPLRAADVRRTLRNLQSLAFVGAAEVRAAHRPHGLDVFVAIVPKLSVESVAVEGELCVRRSLLESRLLQAESTPLQESRVVRGVYRVQDRLEEAGYRNAGVTVRVDVDEEKRVAAVRYVIECGAPTLVERIEFVGQTGRFQASDLEGHLRLKPGDRVRRDRLGEEAERLEQWLIRSGNATAKVDGPRESPATTPQGVVLTYTVDVGPRFEVSVSGVEKAALDRQHLLDLLAEERFSDVLLDQVLAGVRRHYQARGHYQVRVESRRLESDDVVRLEILVEPGPRLEVKRIVFKGNEQLSDEELAGRIATAPRKALARGSGRLVDEELDADLGNLRSHYRLRGFGDAEVGPAEVEVEADGIAIEIPIVEGPRRRVVSIELRGVEDSVAFGSLDNLALVAGGAYHPRLLEEALDEIRARYEEAGYLSAQIEAELSGGREATRLSVVIQVLEGPRVTVGRVLVRGQTRTRSAVIERALGIRRGDVVSRRRLLDAQRRLYRLGIFSRAEVRLVPGMPFADTRDVLVRVAEGRTGRASLGVGYDSEDGLRGLVGYAHSNLLGHAVSLRTELRVSQREWQFRTLVRQPSVGRFEVPLTYSLFGVEEERESFESRRRGLQVEGHRLWDSSRLALLYSYRIVEVLESSGVPLFRLDIDRNLIEAEIASLTPSLLLDRRDDPLVPTAGWMANLQSELAFPFLSADARFLKVFGQYSHYLPLGRLGVVAGSLRVGGVEPLDPDELDPASLVPISEQFFAGGRTTHRAYRRDLLGIPGDTIFLCRRDGDVCVDTLPDGESIDEYRRVAAGGNGLLLANLDYRFPLYGPLGGTVFVDAGNVWGDWKNLDAADIKLGVGAGLRYLSPVGPLRLEVGWKLDREVGESPAVLFLSFGNPF